MNSFSVSPLDTKRFNQNIHRAILDNIDPLEIANYMQSNKVDTLIARIPTDLKAKQYQLNRLGHEVIHADTLVYYFASLRKINELSLRNELIFELIDEKNEFILNEIIPVIFDEYKNHYFSNPYLDKSQILEGYLEWAQSYMRSKNSDKISWLVKLKESYVGFATCSFIEETKECEGVLYGVRPDFSGKGIYSDIIKFTQNYFKEKGYNTMWVSTQIQNFAVQKSWINHGFTLKKAYDTFHLISTKNK